MLAVGEIDQQHESADRACWLLARARDRLFVTARPVGDGPVVETDEVLTSPSRAPDPEELLKRHRLGGRPVLQLQVSGIELRQRLGDSGTGQSCSSQPWWRRGVSTCRMGRSSSVAAGALTRFVAWRPARAKPLWPAAAGGRPRRYRRLWSVWPGRRRSCGAGDGGAMAVANRRWRMGSVAM